MRWARAVLWALPVVMIGGALFAGGLGSGGMYGIQENERFTNATTSNFYAEESNGNNLFQVVADDQEVRFSANALILYSSTSDAAGSADVGLERGSAGVLTINNGSTGTGALEFKQLALLQADANYLYVRDQAGAYTHGVATNRLAIQRAADSTNAIQVNETAVALASDTGFLWSATTDYNGTKDVGLVRNGAGILRVSDGSTGYGQLQLEGGSNGVRILAGSGSPESSISADIGSLYLRTDGGASTTLYVKESSPTASTGWVAK